jgi:hypothetical protein
MKKLHIGIGPRICVSPVDKQNFIKEMIQADVHHVTARKSTGRHKRFKKKIQCLVISLPYSSIF